MVSLRALSKAECAAVTGVDRICNVAEIGLPFHGVQSPGDEDLSHDQLFFKIAVLQCVSLLRALSRFRTRTWNAASRRRPCPLRGSLPLAHRLAWRRLTPYAG